MAVTWQITDSTNTIDLTTAKGTAGWHGERWHINQIADIPGDGSIPEYITETIPVVLSGSDDDNFATYLQTFALLQKEAAEYRVDQQQATPVWYHEKLSAETGERRALVKSLGLAFSQETGGLQAGSPTTVAGKKATLFVKRHPDWERTIARIFPNATPAAAAAVAYDYTDYGPNLVLNEGFETAGAGGADIWASWVGAATDGALANEVGSVHTGVDAAKVTAGPTADTHIDQIMAVVANQRYRLTFYSRGDGTNAGRYAIWDNSNSAYILSPTSTGVPGTTYTVVGHAFTTPDDCVALTVTLYCPTTDTGICYFDTVYLRLDAHDIVGDVPARVNGLAVNCATAATTLYRFWVGIRSANKHGATGISAFVPVWECEDGDIIDAEVAADGGGTEPNTASPGGGSGDFVLVTPVGGGTDWDDGSFHHVVDITLSDVGYTTTADATGRFLVLLRAKVSAGTWQVRLREGYASAQNYHDPVATSSTSWDYLTIAIINMPPRDLHTISTDVAGDGTDLEASIYLYAKRTAGAGNLYVDCFCWIPIDEGSATILDGRGLALYDTVICESPHDKAQAIVIGKIAGTPTSTYMVAFEAENFRLPPGDGRIICVYAQETSSVFTNQVEFADPQSVVSSYTERWTSLRGAE